MSVLDKRMSLDDIVARLSDGMTIGIGGWATRRKPMALVRAIVRSKLKDLTLVSYGGPDVGMLAASGKLAQWDRTAGLGRIGVPTLVIGARYDTMDPSHMEWMAGKLPKGRYLYCPQGSHLAMYDDQKVYVEGVIKFIGDVAGGHYGSDR